MGYLELFPHYYTTCSYFRLFDLEATGPVIEHMRVFSKDPRQQPYYRPGQEATISSRVAAVKERVFLFGMPVQVAVNIDLP